MVYLTRIRLNKLPHNDFSIRYADNHQEFNSQGRHILFLKRQQNLPQLLKQIRIITNLKPLTLVIKVLVVNILNVIKVRNNNLNVLLLVTLITKVIVRTSTKVGELTLS